MRNVMGVLVLTATLLAFAAPASATIVWSAGATSSGEAIVAANDDGSNVRTLVTAASLGMNAVRDPDVQPNGRTVVFTGETRAFTRTCSNGSYFGYYTVGLYAWAPETGAVRMTQNDPMDKVLVDGIACGESLLITDPSLAPDGRTFSISKYQTSTGINTSTIQSQATGSRTGSTESNISCQNGNDPQSLAADPTSVGRLVFTGCLDNGQHALVLASEGQGIGSGAVPLGYDDQEIRDPSMTADGSFVLDVEDGQDPGLWFNEVKPATDPATRHIYALPSPAGVRFESPSEAFPGGGAVLFSARLSSQADDHLYAFDRSQPCLVTQSCTFPADATQLTGTGTNQSPDWTADPLIVPTSPGSGGGTTTPGGTTTTPGSTTTTPGGTTATPTVPAQAPLLVVPARVRALALRKGVTFSVRVGSAGKVSLKATVPARRIGRRGAAVTIATGSATATRRGTVKVRLKLTAAGRRALRRLRGKTVTVAVTHRGRTTKRSVKLR